MQVGAEYVRQVKTIVKSHINALKSTSSPAAPEGCVKTPILCSCLFFLDNDSQLFLTYCFVSEGLSCLLKLKSSTEGRDSDSPIYLRPGSGDSHYL